MLVSKGCDFCKAHPMIATHISCCNCTRGGSPMAQQNSTQKSNPFTTTMGNFTSSGNTADIVELDPATGLYFVDRKQWIVGPHYKIGELLAKGKYGDVVKAMDTRTEREVAIKMVQNFTYGYSCLKSALRQIAIMRRLKHPSLLTLKDAFVMANEDPMGRDLYLVSEYTNGGTLLDLVGPLSVVDVKCIMKQILEALFYMHSCNIFHMNLSAVNVLIFPYRVVKICGFSKARWVFPEDAHRIIKFNPEVKACREQSSARAPSPFTMTLSDYYSALDTWGAACIFWQLLKLAAGDTAIYPICKFYTSRKLMATTENMPFNKRFDLLEELYQVLGAPTWKYIDDTLGYPWTMDLKYSLHKVGNAPESLENTDVEALDLLHSMLPLKPSDRCTSKEALQHSYFNKSGDICLGLYNFGGMHPTLEQIESWIESTEADGQGLQLLLKLVTNEIQEFREQNPHKFEPRKRLVEQDVNRGPSSKRRKSIFGSVIETFKSIFSREILTPQL